MGLRQPFGVGSTASWPKSRGLVFKHDFLGILSTWHGIFCFILLYFNDPDRLVLLSIVPPDPNPAIEPRFQISPRG